MTTTAPIVESTFHLLMTGFAGRRAQRAIGQLVAFHGLEHALIPSRGYDAGFGPYSHLLRLRGSAQAIADFEADLAQLR